MEWKTFFLFAIAASAVSCTQLGFDFSRCKVDTFDAWDQVFFPCAGGSGEYEYKFEKVPKNWYGNRDILFATKGEISSSKAFGVRVRVTDLRSRESFKKCLLFNFQGNRVKNIYEADYEFDLDSQRRLDEEFQRREKGLPLRPPQTPAKIPYHFLDDEELQILVKKCDLKEIRKVLDDAIGCGQDCKLIADFLAKYLGAIRTRIVLIQGNGQRLRKQIKELEEQLKLLQNKLKELQSSSVDLDWLKQELSRVQAELQAKVNQKPTLEGNIHFNEQKISDNEAQIRSLNEITIKNAKIKIDTENEKIGKLDEEIRRLDSQVQELKKSRQESVDRKNSLSRDISEANAKIDSLNAENNRLQTVISDLRNQLNNLIADLTRLQSKIDELQKKIKQEERRQADVKELKNKIDWVQAQLNGKKEEAENLQRNLDLLQDSVEDLQAIIDKHYYGCYWSGRQTGPGEAVKKYLEGVFGSVPNSFLRARLSGETFEIKHTSIFSPKWVRVYGIPYSAGYGSNVDVIENDFKCEELNPNLEIFNGRIDSISKNLLSIKDGRGDAYTVHLGGCTRLETTTNSDLPQVGDQVSFKGSRRVGKDYNGYHVTCY